MSSSCGQNIRSASYEAVNWKIFPFLLILRIFGQPRMRLWIERTFMRIFLSADCGQPRMRLWIERFIFIINYLSHTGQPRMRLWIERNARRPLRGLPSVSLVWGCELKVFYGLLNNYVRVVSLVWGCELKVDASFFSDTEHGGSASYEAVNWKIAVLLILVAFPRSASYEAVNWKDIAEKRISKSYRSASYEAVNWKRLVYYQYPRQLGQPRMRLWIERSFLCSAHHLASVSLVWGCELKDHCMLPDREQSMVSLVWGCELKVQGWHRRNRTEKVSLVWGCELKV